MVYGFLMVKHLPSYTVNEVIEGFKANSNLTIRTESIIQEGEGEGEKVNFYQGEMH